MLNRRDFSLVLQKCHNIIRNNDKLSPEASFDEISKVLFVKMGYERMFSKTFTLSVFLEKKSADGNWGDSQYYQQLFRNIADEYSSERLFDSNDIFRIKETSFEQIVGELESIDLHSFDDDVKGITYETFLSKTFRGELGQFFTPRTVVDFMVDIIDPQENELVCDPCCGSGGFLIKVFEYVKKNILANENIKETDKNDHIRNLSSKCIYGVDANPRMARTAKMNMIMHGDGHGGIYHHDGLLNIREIKDGHFDIVLTNPPFGSRISKDLRISAEDACYNHEYISQKIAKTSNKGIYVKDLFESYSAGKGLTEILFIERCLDLLKPGGRLGIVLPEGVLNNASYQKARAFFETKAKLLFIVSLPQEMFVSSGASVKSSVLVFRKFTNEEFSEYDALRNMVYEEYKKEIDRNVSKEDFISKYIKEHFVYNICLAEVHKAGINAIGESIENELPQLASDFTTYRKENNLW